LAFSTPLYATAIKFLFEKWLATHQGELSEKLKKLDDDLSRKTQSELQKSEAVLTEAQG
jgi:hypothetical protein